LSSSTPAIEKLADRLTTDHDPQIGRVKDMGSAAVGVSLLMAGAFWLFCPRRTHGRDLKAAIEVSACAGHHWRMSEPTFTITLAQLNPTVGDVTGNAAKARAAREKAKADGADLVVLPELFICGYPPEDLVLKPAFQAACRAAVEELARETAGGGPAMLIGTPGSRTASSITPAHCSMRPYRSPSLQGEFAELRRVRRKTPVSRAVPRRGR